jgi:hypothetical protein
MAAEWRIVLDYARQREKFDFTDLREFIVRARRKSFVLIALAEGYALVLELPRRAFSFSRRAVAEAVRELELEAGLPTSNAMGQNERWSGIEVRTAPGDRRRPEAIWFKGAWHPITIMGRYAVPGRTGRPPSAARADPKRTRGGSVGGSVGGGGAGPPPTHQGATPPTHPPAPSLRPGAPFPTSTTAYRARLTTGHEFALVREPMGRWFADDLTGFEPVPR